MLKVRVQEEKHVELLNAGKNARHRLEELAPEIRLKEKGNFNGPCYQPTVYDSSTKCLTILSIHLSESFEIGRNWHESLPFKFIEFYNVANNVQNVRIKLCGLNMPFDVIRCARFHPVT